MLLPQHVTGYPLTELVVVVGLGKVHKTLTPCAHDQRVGETSLREPIGTQDVRMVHVGGRILPVVGRVAVCKRLPARSEEHTSELQSLMRISYAVFCLKKKKKNKIY